MAIVSTLVSVGLEAVAATLLGQTTWRTFQGREHPSAAPFVAVLAMLTLWAGFRLGAELPTVAPDGTLATVCSVGQFGAALLLPGLWTVYTLGYTGRGTGVTRARIALFAAIIVPVVVAVVGVAAGLPERPIAAGLVVLGGPYLGGLFLYGTYLLVSFGGDHPRVSNEQVAVVTGGVAAPYLVSLVWGTRWTITGTSLGLLLAGTLLAVAVRRYPVTTGFPRANHIARTRVVETLQEAVIVLDRDDRILDVNQTTTDLFETTASDIVGEPVEAVADGLGDAELAPGATATLALQTAQGRRRVQLSVSGVTDTPGDERPLARTVLLRDVTDQQTRRQRLSVLNRILRHNVRNDLDAVLAYTDLVDDEEVQSNIRANVTNTLQLSAKARDAEEVMTAITDQPEPVDLAELARSVADQFNEEYPDAVSVECTDTPVVTSHRRIIRRVLVELVENALVHADADDPSVGLSIRHCDGATELVVVDDGPGLPEREQEILAAETETQLKHGQGIGLWFVHWAVTQLGGDLEFAQNEPTGSVVTVRLHGAAR
jgi:signal transduction histidine kinase